MKGLVLLADEVSLLKVATKQGAIPRRGEKPGHEVVCEFFCKTGLAECLGDECRLTAFGQRLARRLIAMGATGTVELPVAILDALVVQTAAAGPSRR